MRLSYSASFLAIGLLTAPLFGVETPPPKDLHRLYDLTPVSGDNPVLAKVEGCGIEIPVSEFRTYVASLSDQERKPGPVTPEVKKAYLNNLLDEHFLLWQGYQKKGDQTQGMTEMLKNTEAMLMQETLTEQEVGSKAK